jgi:hypothetical protein
MRFVSRALVSLLVTAALGPAQPGAQSTVEPGQNQAPPNPLTTKTRAPAAQQPSGAQQYCVSGAVTSGGSGRTFTVGDLIAVTATVRPGTQACTSSAGRVCRATILVQVQSGARSWTTAIGAKSGLNVTQNNLSLIVSTFPDPTHPSREDELDLRFVLDGYPGDFIAGGNLPVAVPLAKTNDYWGFSVGFDISLPAHGPEKYLISYTGHDCAAAVPNIGRAAPSTDVVTKQKAAPTTPSQDLRLKLSAPTISDQPLPQGAAGVPSSAAQQYCLSGAVTLASGHTFKVDDQIAVTVTVQPRTQMCISRGNTICSPMVILDVLSGDRKWTSNSSRQGQLLATSSATDKTTNVRIVGGVTPIPPRSPYSGLNVGFTLDGYPRDLLPGGNLPAALPSPSDRLLLGKVSFTLYDGSGTSRASYTGQQCATPALSNAP